MRNTGSDGGGGGGGGLVRGRGDFFMDSCATASASQARRRRVLRPKARRRRPHAFVLATAGKPQHSARAQTHTSPHTVPYQRREPASCGTRCVKVLCRRGGKQRSLQLRRHETQQLSPRRRKRLGFSYRGTKLC